MSIQVFLLLKLNSTKNPMNELFKVNFFMYLQVISCLIQNKIPPPFAVRSSLNDFEKHLIEHYDSGKVSSIFVSDAISISRLLPTNLASDYFLLNLY